MRKLPRAGLASLILLAGCSGLPFRMPFTGPKGIERGFTLQDLQLELAAYARRFDALVSSASDEISDAAASRLVRKRALLWQLRMVPVVEQAAYVTNPRAAYLYTLAVAVMQRRYLEDGDGRALFGDQQEIALEAARQLEDDAVGIGRSFLTRSELKRVTGEVDELAARYPIRGKEFAYQGALGVTESLERSQSLQSLLTLPLAPFRALEGVDSGAQAIHDFNQTARRFSDVVARLPEQMRGEAQLLLYDVEDRETVTQLLAAFEEVAASATRVSEVAARLPQDLRGALAETGAPLEQARDVLAEAQALAGPLDATAEKLRLASADWRAVLGDREARERTQQPGERPFDVREWESAAQAIGEAAVRLDALALRLDGMAGGEGLRTVVDRAAWRAAQLLVLLFVLLLAYRALASRLVRRPAPRA